MSKYLKVSFDSILDGDTKLRIKKTISDNLSDYFKENGIITDYDRRLNKIYRLISVAQSDNEILFVIRLLSHYGCRKPASELDFRLKSIFESL